MKVWIGDKQYEEVELECALCGAQMRLKASKYGIFYGCPNYPQCTGTHSAHKDTGLPLGKPADHETRRARILAHEAFDQLWQGGPVNMKRGDAYAWLQQVMCMSELEAHIANFDKAQCERVIDAVAAEFKSRGYPYVPEAVRMAKQPGYADAKQAFIEARNHRRAHPGNEVAEVLYREAKKRMDVLKLQHFDLEKA
jgi:ssDNA-binding Zn-finger/Zn-ribbon topoisomerase 1